MVFVAHRAGTSGLEFLGPPANRPLVVLDSLGFYLMKLFAPIGLAIDYGRTPEHVQVGLPMALGGLFLLLLAIAVIHGLILRGSWPLAGMLIFVAGLLPVLGLLPFTFQFYSSVADRYVYLAMIGPAVIVTGLLQPNADLASVVPRQAFTGARSVAAAIVIALLSAASFVQAGVWTSDQRLFAQALAVNPDSIAANQTLGFLAAQAAEQTSDRRRQNQLLATAFEYDRRALAVNPDNPRVHYNRANLLLRIGKPDQALTDYAAAAGSLFDEARLQNNWGVACLELKKNNEAVEHFRLATQADPNFADALANLGIAYLQSGQLDRARESFRSALSLNPNQPQAIAGLRKADTPPG